MKQDKNHKPKRSFKPKKEKLAHQPLIENFRLNRYLAHCGIASRRKSDEIIRKGFVKVNGKVEEDPSYLVLQNDKVFYKNQLIIPEKLIYLLLNKPKNIITTVKDENGRRTVIDLIQRAFQVAKLPAENHVVPVGRLDRNTTGVLLLTNDGQLIQELTHPSKGVEKIYQVRLNKAVTETDMEKLAAGVDLEDGFMQLDQIAYVHESTPDEVGVVIHSGKNRIVRRLFEHIGYEILKLDRVSFAGFTKKDTPRGKWRFLKEEEVRNLKYFNKVKG